jgi:hypothetical protein
MTTYPSKYYIPPEAKELMKKSDVPASLRVLHPKSVVGFLLTNKPFLK